MVGRPHAIAADPRAPSVLHRAARDGRPLLRCGARGKPATDGAARSHPSAPPATLPRPVTKPAAKKEPERPSRWRDHIEAATMAIVVAVMLKYFAIEAYQIPSGSMQPTLMG